MPFRSNYRKVVLKKFPAAYWRLGESSGIVAADESGNGNAGTYTGGVTLGQPGAIAGDTNTAALFNGSTGYIPVSGLGINWGVNGGSVEVWSEVNIGLGDLCIFGAQLNSSFTFRLRTSNAFFELNLNGFIDGQDAIRNVPAVFDGLYHHYVVTWHPINGFKAYRDGILIRSVGTNLATVTTTAPLWIGRRGGGANEWFNGVNDEGAIYNFELTQEQVLENYEAGIHAIEYNVNIPCPPGFKEYDIFIRPDGVQYLLGDIGRASSERRNVMSIEGDGMPPLQYITERSPYQDGETVRGLFLQPRIVQYLIRQKFGSRNNYWDGRGALMNAIRPNRGQGTLRRILSTGEQRDLDVYVLEGPQFRARSPNEWAEWTINEIVRFIAHNPVYYDPTQYSLSFTTGGGLTFPITFPITFSGFGFVSTINYLGSWKEYPTIRIDGPISSAEVINQTTGESIAITYALPVGRYIEIILTPGNKRILLDNGTDLIATLNANSDLATFHLDPGLNSIEVNVAGDGASTAVSILYYHRYLGVPQ